MGSDDTNSASDDRASTPPSPLELHELTIRFLRLADTHGRFLDFQKEVCGLVADFANAAEVLLLLLEGDSWTSYRWITGSEGGLQIDDRRGKVDELMELIDNSGVDDPIQTWKQIVNHMSEANQRGLGGAVKSAFVFPLTWEGERLGALVVASATTATTSAMPTDVLAVVAQHLSATLVFRRRRAALAEREKELGGLYGLFRLAEQPEINLETILEEAAASLPAAWQFPEIAHGSILLDGTRYPREESQAIVAHATQRGDIVIEGETRGYIEVAYDKPMPALDEGPFLKEERYLINAIARQIAMVVQRRLAEEERERLREQLRHADRLATIGQLASGVAHELNEPLGNILGLAQLALKAPDLQKGTERDLRNVEKASLHAREVIKKLMLFARQTPPQVVEADMNQLVENGLYFLASRCTKEGIDLKVELEPDLPPLQADPGQLHQVLVNLVVNALQSMSAGGRLTVRTRHETGRIVLEVEDTGEGIDEEIRQHIFVPFFTTKDVDEGTGLGLSVVHGIVTAHRGVIEVESEKGKGTTFQVRFPTVDCLEGDG